MTWPSCVGRSSVSVASVELGGAVSTAVVRERGTSLSEPVGGSHWS